MPEFPDANRLRTEDELYVKAQGQSAEGKKDLKNLH